MKALHKCMMATVLLAVAIYCVPLLAQSPIRLTRTTLAAAQTLNATTLQLTSVTGVSQSSGSITTPSSSAGTFAVFVDMELECVTAVSGTTLTVRRGCGGTRTPHANAAPAWFDLQGSFQSSDPPIGACTSPVAFVPWINASNGNVWLCRSSAWAAANHQPITWNSDPGQTSLSP